MSLLAYLVNFSLQGKSIQTGERKRKEQAYSPVENKESIAKSSLDLLSAPANGRWIGNAPMRSHGLTRPDGARFLGRVITNRKHKMEFGCAGLREFIPRLTPQPCGGQACSFELP